MRSTTLPDAGSCSNFLYVFKAARNGPLTPPPGRVPRAAAGAWPGHAGSPSAGVEPRSRAATTGTAVGLRRLGDLAGSRPVRPGRCGPAAPRPAVGRVTAVELRVRQRAWCPGRPSTVKGASRRKRRPQTCRPGQGSLCDPELSGVKRQADGLPAGGRTPPHPITRRDVKP